MLGILLAHSYHSLAASGAVLLPGLDVYHPVIMRIALHTIVPTSHVRIATCNADMNTREESLPSLAPVILEQA
jgi:hypothetical protein